MSLNEINNVNNYLVNELFGNKNNNTQVSKDSIMYTLQNLNEKYVEISTFGKKLNDIYNTLTESDNVNQNVLEGARDVILELANTQLLNNLNWVNTVNNIDNLKNNPDMFSKFFTEAKEIKDNNLDLSNWLNAFNNVYNYGLSSDFINQTSEILNNSNDKDLLAYTFQNFVNTINNIVTSSPNENITRQSLSTFFNGLESLSILQEKDAFITNFKAG